MKIERTRIHFFQRRFTCRRRPKVPNNTPLTPKKSISFDNEAASTSLKGQVARSSRRSVAPVQWSLSVLCQKFENTESCSNRLHHSM